MVAGLSEATNAEHRAFVTLVRELRDLGATRVRDGGLEVSFAEPLAVAGKDEPQKRVAYSVRETDELAELRAFKAEQEELG